MRIGLMGGTFDPIHIGHLLLGETAYEQYHLDKVIYMPAGNPNLKLHREGRATNRQRYDMTALATADNPHFEISDREMKRTGFSYTYLTLEEMKAEHPDDEIFFIIGADSLYSLPDWYLPERVCAACTLLVAVRDHKSDEELAQQIRFITEKYHAQIQLLDSGNIDCSSSMIRDFIETGRSIRYYVPESVISYIDMHKIYRKENSHG